MAKYNVGDKVRIIGKRGIGWNSDGLMDKWCNQIMTIREVGDIFGYSYYHMVEDAADGWMWSDDDIAKLVMPCTCDNKHTPMPKLTTGMFGKEDDGDMFVVIDNRVVYRGGQHETVDCECGWQSRIVALYECDGFMDIEDGSAKVIWERVDNVTEVTEAPADTSPAILALIEKLFGDAK